MIYRLTRQGQYTVFASFDIEKRNGTALLGGLTEWQGTFYGIAGAARGYSIYSIGADHERAVAHIPSKNQISGDLVGLGTTLYGVFGNPNDGAVYSVDRGGKFRVVYAFKGGTDAAFPIDVVAHNGTLYGIALEGDAVRCRCASIFSVTPSGKERVLYRFKGVQTGEVPVPSLSFDSQGNLYGAAAPYLSYGDCPYSHVRSCGSVFEIAHAGLGRFTVLHQFHGGSDGMTPNGNLILDSADNIFGTTEYGGGGPCPALGCGTIYELKRSEGTYSERMIHTFSGSGDGALPTMGLL